MRSISGSVLHGRAAIRRWSHRTFVALGDSFTEGLEDDLGPAGRHLGWADRVAAALATREGGLRYANLAVRGRLLDQVVAEQVPAALALGPDLVSFHAGPNDVLPPAAATSTRSSPATPRRSAGLRAAGVQVLLFTVIERAGGTGRTAARLAARFARFNAGVRRTAQRTGALVVDVGCGAGPAGPAALARGPAAPGRRPGTPGSRRPCSRCSGSTDPDLLGGAARLVAGAAGARRPAGPAGRRVADVRWVRRYLAPWVRPPAARRAPAATGSSPKHLELVDLVPGRAGRVSRRLRRCAAGRSAAPAPGSRPPPAGPPAADPLCTAR